MIFQKVFTALALGALALGAAAHAQVDVACPNFKEMVRNNPSTCVTDQEEINKIQTWIWRHNLDCWGNEAGSMYSGVSPVPEGGDFLCYIVQHHPAKPWLFHRNIS